MGGAPTKIISRWKGGMGFEAVNAQGISVRMDPPSEKAFLSPMELVLAALAGCTGMDVVSILEKKRQPPASMEIRVSGTRAEDHPRVYTSIEVEYILAGAGLTADAVARAIELSTQKYCSVGGMLARTAPIRTSFRIVAIEEGSA